MSPPGDHSPAAHAVHDVLCVSVVYLPAGHASQTDDQGLGAYVPTLHSVHVDAAARLNFPATHTSHATLAPREYRPGVHAMHDVAPSCVVYVPGSHD